ncbi:DgyrCDS8330 [Dimorphilus gyrociliatus]|uniref:DgyrCDS8330 n=1 Tax=Dimorphilus gyrociliatus TaxID=2664684 RepID=A0A7I8VUT2_9ANNE|nr:DgyrCDS8330 [Dimorphilus gyrociliatus]
MYIWRLHQEGPAQKIFFRNSINCFDITLDGKFLIACLGEKISVFELSTGSQICNLSAHYLPIKKIKLAQDDSFFVTVGSDSFAVLWTLKNTANETHQEYELCRLNGHSGAINDVFLSHGGLNCTIYTASSDHSCILWNTKGSVLKKVVCQNALQCVTVDCQTGVIYLGDAKGNIILNKNDSTVSIKAASSEIRCLSLNIDTSVLASASTDKTVKLWNSSRKETIDCIKVITLTGFATNLQFFMAPSGLGLKKSNLTLEPIPIAKSMQSSKENMNVLTKIINQSS